MTTGRLATIQADGRKIEFVIWDLDGREIARVKLNPREAVNHAMTLLNAAVRKL